MVIENKGGVAPLACGINLKQISSVIFRSSIFWQLAQVLWLCSKAVATMAASQGWMQTPLTNGTKHIMTSEPQNCSKPPTPLPRWPSTSVMSCKTQTIFQFQSGVLATRVPCSTVCLNFEPIDQPTHTQMCANTHTTHLQRTPHAT